MNKILMTMHGNYSPEEKRRILNYLLTFISENKRQKFEKAIRFRTRYITVILEDIYQPHNASAVLRSCDCFGIQDVHIIENRNKYEVNPDVALGSAKWLNLIKYNAAESNTTDCLVRLKETGYRIVAASPHRNEFTAESYPLTEKIALLFGTELSGLTKEARDMADNFISIPMVGFTESLNISVSAAIFLWSLTNRLHGSDIDWHLTGEEETDTLISWASSVIKKPGPLIHDFMGDQ